MATAVTISGSNFGATQGHQHGHLQRHRRDADVVVREQHRRSRPAGATTGNVVVTVGGLASNALPYTVIVPPVMTSLSPSSGPVATVVTISGTNFGATKGTSTITFNGTAAVPTSWSATSIVVPVPAGAISGNVVVTVGGLASRCGNEPAGEDGPSRRAPRSSRVPCRSSQAVRSPVQP